MRPGMYIKWKLGLVKIAHAVDNLDKKLEEKSKMMLPEKINSKFNQLSQNFAEFQVFALNKRKI